MVISFKLIIFFIPTVKLKLHLKSKLINPSNRLIEIVNLAGKRGIHRMKTLKIEPHIQLVFGCPQELTKILQSSEIPVVRKSRRTSVVHYF